MEYSYLTGLLTNIDLTVAQWSFALLASTVIEFLLVYLMHFSNARKNPIRVASVFLFMLIALGIIGLIIFAILYLIIYAIYSDFSKDYE